MGLFAEWQPAYEEAGIATFPVDGVEKRPAVGNYLKAGCRASKQWALKFPQASALGFACGARNRLTVLDVDTTDERVLSDAFGLFGRSPVVIRTASGKYHAWYRHNGEKRKIRAPQIDGPVDILGGGFAVAPPSQGSLGQYEFIEGSLADLASLPAMRMLEPVPANDEGGRPLAEVGEGKRNDSLWRSCMAAAAQCSTHDNLLRFARSLNGSGQWTALPDDEVRRIVGSAWRCQVEGRNGFAGDRFVQIARDVHAVLSADPDAYYLYGRLRAEHWGRDFLCTNSWAESLPLSLARLQKARQFLLKHGLIVLVRRERRGEAAIYRFSPLKECNGGGRRERV